MTWQADTTRSNVRKTGEQMTNERKAIVVREKKVRALYPSPQSLALALRGRAPRVAVVCPCVAAAAAAVIGVACSRA
jgi:hypothetical protein